jgi:hypothetical protein
MFRLQILFGLGSGVRNERGTCPQTMDDTKVSSVV